MRYLLLLLLVSGCAHYNSILPHYNVGQRHPDKIQFSSCTNYIVGFSTNENGMSYANALDHVGLTPDQVFSVDEKRWLWTWPFYYWRCLDINTNDRYTPKPTSHPKTETAVLAPVPAPKKDLKPQGPEAAGTVTGNYEYDLSLCSKLKKKEASACRKLIERQYDSLQKIK